jgi:hypothetical protein
MTNLLARLDSRATLTIFAVMVISVCFTLFVSYVYLQQTYLRVVASRMTVVAYDIRQSLEARINLGLPLTLFSETQGTIDREKARGHGIDLIEVFIEPGKVLYSTDRGSIGEPVQRSWLDSSGTLRRDAWTLIEPDGVVVGLPVVDNLNRPVGGVALKASQTLVGSQNAEFLALSVTVAVAFAVLAGLLALLAANLMLVECRRFLADCVKTFVGVRVDDGSGLLTPQFTGPVGEAASVAAAALEAVTAADRAVQTYDEQI